MSTIHLNLHRLLLGIGSVVVHKTQKIFESKAKKHDKIKTLAESKLDIRVDQQGYRRRKYITSGISLRIIRDYTISPFKSGN